MSFDVLYSLVIKWRFVSRVEDQMKKFMEVRVSMTPYLAWNKLWQNMHAYVITFILKVKKFYKLGAES